jgi:hypothetical protein
MKLLLENWREYLKEEKRISVKDIHELADTLNISWDGDTEFMSWTKELIDPDDKADINKSHLDNLTSEELFTVYTALKKKDRDTIIIPTRDEVVRYITSSPHQEIFLDNPKGSSKAFGHGKKNKVILPFDYGEYSGIINPADDMGWDIIIVPSATVEDELLIPVGHVAYSSARPKKVGNDKIIIAPNGQFSSSDQRIIDDFFVDLEGFEPIVWY